MKENDLDQEGPVPAYTAKVENRVFEEFPSLPEDFASLPDLLLMGNGTHTFPISEEMHPRDAENWNFTMLHHHQMQVRPAVGPLHRLQMSKNS